MGLLDEAIREHLDLRRRHGADPEEVAREERDALAPVERDGRPEHSSALAHALDGADGEEPRGRAPFDGRRAMTRDDGERGDRPPHREVGLMEETAEIDMHAVLGGIEDAMSSEEGGGDARVRRARPAERVAPVAAGGGSRPASDFEVDDDSLAWATPAPRVRRIERAAGE